MKRSNNLYHYVTDINNIIRMTYQVCKNVKNKEKVDKFETFWSEHIISIKNRLENKDYNFGKYNIFMITDPKCRIVMGQSIEDKIINHLIAEYFLVRVFEPKYINSMVATRVGRGSSYGIFLLKKYLNSIKRKYNNFYVLKIDIKKYFYNLDHNILKRILKDNIKDKEALDILNKVIDSTNESYINKEIIRLKNTRINFLNNCTYMNKLEKEKLIKEVISIPIYEKRKGCSIGNQTSQAFGLIYLYELSHYIKEKLNIKYLIIYMDDIVILNIKYLIIYMDDIVILHNDKEYLKYVLKVISNILYKEFKLEININKTIVDNIKNGKDFLGYKFYIKNNKVIMKLKNRNKKNYKKRIKDLNVLYREQYISKSEYKMYMSSYNGLLQHGNCNNLIYNNIM